MKRSLKFFVLTWALVGLFPVASSAITGLSLGVRGGSSQYSGDVLPGSGDIGSGTMLGVHLKASTLPIIDLEIAAEFFQKDFDYALPVARQVGLTFRDAALRATVKYGVFSPPLSPISVYVGVGGGLDFLNTAYPDNVTLGDADKEKLLEDSAKKSYHGLAGVRVSLPAVPFAIFAEGRYSLLKAEENVKNISVYGGLDLKLP